MKTIDDFRGLFGYAVTDFVNTSKSQNQVFNDHLLKPLEDLLRNSIQPVPGISPFGDFVNPVNVVFDADYARSLTQSVGDDALLKPVMVVIRKAAAKGATETVHMCHPTTRDRITKLLRELGYEVTLGSQFFTLTISWKQ